ncbi:M20/M25/M40 family metallo-hydrolase [Hydrogenoanaerobacterium sp.]|uniref:M42 family metallopeptidase n=1 Tax=Hydrogenoanaerobacterium sp. TaxID=2953763 RepID=UPI00289ADA1A|nr:M20/M25/M40 family metallo-hydrolase [Hydrogenoanaerobacterium sp.]
MDIKELTLQLAAAVGVSGAENNVTSLAADILAPYGAVRIDNLGNLICSVREAKQGARHYMLDAHIDEIGMIVTYIDSDGFLKVSIVGGIDRRLLLASEVVVHGKQPLTGIICSTPPHLQGDGEKKNPKIDDLYIDIGMNREQAQAAVCLGDRVTIKARSREMLGDLITSKALDDRAGCAAVIRAVQLLADTDLDCGITLTLTTQEETGAAGAKTAAFSVAPTHCITVDVSFGYTPDAPRHKCGDLCKGPMIGIAPILSKHMSDRMIEIAKECGIPYQLEVMGGTTGTNADGIVPSGAGVATSLLSIPQHYMHTPVEKVSVGDIENTAKLIVEFIKTEEAHK